MWELFEEAGVRLLRADNNRVQGWMQVKEALAPRGNGQPRLQIFSTCRELVRCLTALRHDPHCPGDCATEPHEITHLPDALRYFLRSRVVVREKKKEEEKSPLAVYYARRRGQERKGRFN